MTLTSFSFRMTPFMLGFSLISLWLTPLTADWQTPPEQFTSSGTGFSPDIAADSFGKAMAVWVDNSIVKASHFSNGAWGAFTSISTNSGTNSSSQIAYDDSGRALAIWVASGTPNSVHSAFFNGTSWSEPPVSPLDSGINAFQSPSVAMDGSGNGISGWIELTTNQVRTSVFSSSFWNSSTLIGTGDGTFSIAYNKNHRAVAAWTNAGVVTVNQLISGVWQTATPIGEVGDINPQVGIDANDHAHVIGCLTPRAQSRSVLLMEQLGQYLRSFQLVVEI